MNYHKITKYDTSNGPGIRTTLWVSGCNHFCKNCHNPETWGINSGKVLDGKIINEILESLDYPYISGITFSGGDPLHPYNRETVTSIIKFIRMDYGCSKSIWVYTGYLYEEVKSLELMNYIDVLVDGEYVEGLRDLTLPYCGSTNQRVIDVRKSKNNIVLYEN